MGKCLLCIHGTKTAYKEDRGDVCTMPYGINTPGACNTTDERGKYFVFQLLLYSVLSIQHIMDVLMETVAVVNDLVKN